MLRSVAFKNFLCFRDRQSLQFENGPNFLVGANGTGKTAIFELIRRCLSRSVNVTDSAVHDNNNNAFVISEFEIRDKLSDDVPAGCQLYSLYVRHFNGENYKLVCINKQNDIECYIDFGDDLEATVEEGLEKMQGALTKLIEVDDSDPHLKEINGMVKAIKEKATKEKATEVKQTKCERVLQDLNKTVVVTFSTRSIGPLQWSHTKNIGKGDQHYRTTSKNAEIIQTLMRDEEKPGDGDEESDVFQEITFPLEYHVQRNKEQRITVLNRGREIELLKVPEGIIEAKQFSLMYTHWKYQTLLLEEPDRGMHPQMIQKLRNLVFRECEKKKIVLVIISHQPVMINTRAMSRLHVCRRKTNEKGQTNEKRQTDKTEFRHSIIKLKDIEIHQHQDQLKDMLYSAAVLFVEGITDRTVIGWVFDKVLDVDELGEFTNEELGKLKANISGTQIIAMQGGKAHGKMKELAGKLGVPFAFLLDEDIVFKYQRKKDFRLKEKIKNFCSKVSNNKPVNIKDMKPPSLELNKDVERCFKIEDRTDPKKIRADLAGQNAFVWDYKDLEVVICKSIINTATSASENRTKSEPELENVLRALEDGKMAILKVNKETVEYLVSVLLKGKVIEEFLRFLLKRKWNLNKEQF